MECISQFNESWNERDSGTKERQRKELQAIIYENDGGFIDYWWLLTFNKNEPFFLPLHPLHPTPSRPIFAHSNPSCTLSYRTPSYPCTPSTPYRIRNEWQNDKWVTKSSYALSKKKKGTRVPGASLHSWINLSEFLSGNWDEERKDVKCRNDQKWVTKPEMSDKTINEWQKKLKYFLSVEGNASLNHER